MNATEHNLSVLNAAFQDLAKAERKLNGQQGKQRAKLADLQAKHEAENAPLLEEIAALREKIGLYAEAHREELTGGKGKTVKLAAGVIKWRKLPAKVEITGDTATILAALKRRRLSRFIRVKEEIDRTAILKEAAAIKTPIDGLNIVAGGETLSIEAGA